jgi:hypothetical protein
MDVMGIERQLIFPQVVLAQPAWSTHPNAQAVLREYNDAVLRWTAAGRGRLRPTALLNLTTIQGALAEAERVASGGARAVFIQDGVAPGGRSPAAPEVDPLWALLAEAASDLAHRRPGRLRQDAWPDADLLALAASPPANRRAPHAATMHLAPRTTSPPDDLRRRVRPPPRPASA